MTIPFMDLGRLHASIRDDLDDAIARGVSRSLGSRTRSPVRTG
jgi:hypothetical protein